MDRVCGVCTTVHALASVRAVENALKMEVPLNAQYVRNMIIAAHGVHDHMVHFYHLSALDWVDITSALKADPKKAAQLADGLSSWPNNSPQQLKAVQDKLKTLVASGISWPPPITSRPWTTSARPTRSSPSWAARRPTSPTWCPAAFPPPSI